MFLIHRIHVVHQREKSFSAGSMRLAAASLVCAPRSERLPSRRAPTLHAICHDFDVLSRSEASVQTGAECLCLSIRPGYGLFVA